MLDTQQASCYNEPMRLSAFETYVHDHLQDGLTIKSLSREIGVCRQTLWRKFRQAPWREGRGLREGRLFSRLAISLFGGGRLSSSDLDRSRKTLMWLSGFNPFVENGLTVEESLDLYRTVERRVGELLAKREAHRGA